MQRDFRNTVWYRDAEALYRSARQPGTGQVSDATELHVSPDGQRAIFSGVIIDALEGAPTTRICQVDLGSGALRVSTFGPNTDRLPKYSPDGRYVAFLSDRHKAGDFQLYLLDTASGAARGTAAVEGWVEYLHWSPDGTKILLGVAGNGADLSGAQGAVTSNQVAEGVPSWMPAIETGDEGYRWRRAWIYELASGRARPLGSATSNVWEAVWCGNSAVAMAVSTGPGEGMWYGARLHRVNIDTGTSVEMYNPQYQLGWPAASPSGVYLAVVEGICSDRWFVAGDLRLIDTRCGKIRHIDTQGVDITHTEWRSDVKLLLAGHRGFETVVGQYDATSDKFTTVWSSREITTGGRYITLSGFGEIGDCVLAGEGFCRAPDIAVIRQGRYETVRSLDLGYADQAKVIESVEHLSWKAADGLEVLGYLLRPVGEGPFPVVMDVHGGPVWHWRPRWLGRTGVQTLMLLKGGYAVFLPNPRGSSGRGQDYTRHVLGDMGGADTYDCLSGLDYLTERGIADPGRIGVTGVSYGGFMSAWLITQDLRFAAAVPVAPVTNYVTEHLISNIPHWPALFLADSYNNPAGKYFQRSPVMHAHKAKTPTLNICGALDRSAPPEEAVQFHNALLGAGTKSILVTYPEEGHGVRKLPAAIDYAARVVSWFQEHV